MDYNQEEKMLLAWIEAHPMIDKDLELKQSAKRSGPSRRTTLKKRKKSLDDSPFGEPDEEIDLHGCEAMEAVEKVDSIIHAMIPAGYKVLRIIHGGGNLKYGNVKRYVDQHIKTRLKHLVEYYALERNNAGSSLLKIKSNIEKAAPVIDKDLELKQRAKRFGQSKRTNPKKRI